MNRKQLGYQTGRLGGRERGDLRTDGILRSAGKEENPKGSKHLETEHGEVIQKSWEAEGKE